jgi:hypothetical protein
MSEVDEKVRKYLSIYTVEVDGCYFRLFLLVDLIDASN